RGKIKPPNLKNKIVIIVDDGIATGATMILCARIVKKTKPKKLIIAIPVGPIEGVEKLKDEADEVICLKTPIFFGAVGEFYENFQQVSDEEAKNYLKEIENLMKKKR
ncbi:TPA: phosphoribosyltransferase, partial [archaeon]|nr:phosphoribosyltransferase [Candidatus Naiadarchaeales archaeon SRR2090153.bin1042]